MNFADAVAICRPLPETPGLPARSKAQRYLHAAMQLAARSDATAAQARRLGRVCLMSRATRQTWGALRLLRWAAQHDYTILP